MVIALGAAMHGNATGGGDQFSRLVRHILVKEKRDSISSLASAMGMSYANFHARVIGRVRFRPDEINQLIHVLPDPRLSEFLLRGTAFMAVARPRPDSRSSGDALHTATHLASVALAIIDKIGDTFTQGDSDPGGADLMRDHVHQAEIAIGSLRASLSVRNGWNATGVRIKATHHAADRTGRNSSPLSAACIGSSGVINSLNSRSPAE